jgi:hypothetical protein
MQEIEIRIKGLIDPDWSDSLAGLKVVHTPDDITVLSGPVRDHAAVQGLLSQLYNLGFQVISFSSQGAEDVAGNKRLAKG